ncbi:hypothetical protein RCL1_001219 [Eukaryota sp. TZLM3-RCL]
MNSRLTEALLRQELSIDPDVDSSTVVSIDFIGDPGRPKISSFGNAFARFFNLKQLDVSRNLISSLSGLEACVKLETLVLYYNKITSIDEIQQLRKNSRLRHLDLRLNPICRLLPNYRLEVLARLPGLQTLDCRTVDDSEREDISLVTNHYPSTQQVSYSSESEEEQQEQQKELDYPQTVKKRLNETVFTLQTLFERLGISISKGKNRELQTALFQLLSPLVDDALSCSATSEHVKDVYSHPQPKYEQPSTNAVESNEAGKLLLESHQALIKTNENLLQQIQELKEREANMTQIWEQKFNHLKAQFAAISEPMVNSDDDDDDE